MLLHKREHNPFLQFFIQLFTISSVRSRTIFHMDRVGGILSLLIVIVVGKRLCFYRLFVSEPGSWEWGMQKGFRVGILVCRMVDVGCAWEQVPKPSTSAQRGSQENRLADKVLGVELPLGNETHVTRARRQKMSFYPFKVPGNQIQLLVLKTGWC